MSDQTHLTIALITPQNCARREFFRFSSCGFVRAFSEAVREICLIVLCGCSYACRMSEWFTWSRLNVSADLQECARWKFWVRWVGREALKGSLWPDAVGPAVKRHPKGSSPHTPPPFRQTNKMCLKSLKLEYSCFYDRGHCACIFLYHMQGTVALPKSHHLCFVGQAVEQEHQLSETLTAF